MQQKHIRFLKLKLSLLFSICLSSCTTQTLTLKTEGKADLFQLTEARAEEELKQIGTTPYALELKENLGKAFMISQPNKKPSYILVADASGEMTEISLKMREVPPLPAKEELQPTQKKNNSNEVLRLLLPALKALYSQNYALAIKLSEKAEQLSPELAAPLVIHAQALIGLGQKQSAKQVFQKAKKIDPEDPEIIEAIRGLK